MAPRFTAVTILMSVVVVFVLIQMITELSRKQSIALIWSAVMLVMIFFINYFDLLSVTIWDVEHPFQSSEQRLFIGNMKGSNKDKAHCKKSFFVQNWLGSINTVMTSSTNNSIFLELQAGPHFNLQSADEFDQTKFWIQPGNSVYDKIIILKKSQYVSFSGYINPLPRHCETSELSVSTANFRLDITSIDRADRFVLPHSFFIILSWVMLSCPVWILMSLLPRSGSNVFLKKQYAHNNYFHLESVDSGSYDIKIFPLLEEYKICVAEGRKADALKIAVQLENARPTSEVEWLLVSKLFISLGKYAVDEIICERFIADNLSNVSARLYLLGILCRHPHSQERALKLATSILRTFELTSKEKIKLGEMLEKLGRTETALEVYSAVHDLNDDGVNALSHLVATLIKANRISEARRNLMRLQDIIPAGPLRYIIAAEFYARMKAIKDLKHYGDMANKTIDQADSPLLLRVARAYATGGLHQQAKAGLINLNLVNVESTNVLINVARLAEEYGLIDIAINAYAKLTVLDPENEAVRQKSKMLSNWGQC